MSTAILERVGVPDDDGDNYARVGVHEAELHANHGEPQPIALSERAKAMGYVMLQPGEHLPGYSPKPAMADAPRAMGSWAMTLAKHYN
jgi:hypothetical protein